MKFSEIVDQAVELLRARGRMSYRALQREFTLDEQRQRISLRAARLPGERIYFQACADTGRGLQLHANGTTQSVTRADGAGN